MAESFSVEDAGDGYMLITAKVKCPPKPIKPFAVSGKEAVKRYKKYIALTAAGMFAQFAPEFVPIALGFAEYLGDDVDAD
jgi:hypothetical protein